jgi:helix-turn-helix protein
VTQGQRILNHLRSGKHLTALEALHRFECLRLAPRILELKEAGYRITSQLVKVASGKRVALYTMAREVPATR